MQNPLRAKRLNALRQHFVVVMVTAVSLGASTAFASGSMSPGLSAGPDAYAAGKSILYKQVVCASCPYAGRAKDAASAQSLRDALNAADSKVKLDNDEKVAVNTFLTERFRLSAPGMADKK